MRKLTIHLLDFFEKEIVEVRNFKYIGDIDCQSDVSVSFRATKISDLKVYISGEVTGFIEQECSRCLNGYRHSLKIPITLDIDVGSEDNSINVHEEVRQLIILEMPLKPICKPECLGICKVCGRRNEKAKSCFCVDKGDDFARDTWKRLLNKYRRN